MLKTFVVDIDGTLVFSESKTCGTCGKRASLPKSIDKEEVERVNRMYFQGHTIIVFTSRSWNLYFETVELLKKIGVRYHELVMGKPQGIIIDKDSRRSLRDFE
jgi:hydroxymethylpyrimidine pyrophosphatase-like HAD family hydrolase